MAEPKQTPKPCRAPSVKFKHVEQNTTTSSPDHIEQQTLEQLCALAMKNQTILEQLRTRNGKLSARISDLETKIMSRDKCSWIL